MEYREYLNKRLKDPKFEKEFDSLEPEHQLTRAIINLRIKQGMSQQDLSDLIGINRADISQIENGNDNPSLKTKPFELSVDPFYSEENLKRLSESIKDAKAGDNMSEHELIETD